MGEEVLKSFVECKRKERERTFKKGGTNSTYNIVCAVCLTANQIREAIIMTQQFLQFGYTALPIYHDSMPLNLLVLKKKSVVIVSEIPNMLSCDGALVL